MLTRGTPIGPYTVMDHVGAEGTMAEVYRAVDKPGRQVALKILGSTSPRAWVEAEASTHFVHRNIVRTFEVLEWNGCLCLVQEWLEGRSLRAVLDSDGRLDLAQTRRVGLAVAAALAYAHSRGILHRDIKPSNVLHTIQGDYKLLDFGAIGVLDPETGRTRTGEMAGTPLYMSPEQAFARPQTAASDVYGLGLLLFECYHGNVPSGSSDDFVQLVTVRLSAPIVVPASPLKWLLDRCLDRDPALRPQSATEVLQALEQLAPSPGPAYGQIAPPTVSTPRARPSAWHRLEARALSRAKLLSGSRVVRVRSTVLIVLEVLVVAGLFAPDLTDVGFWVRLVAGLVVVAAALQVARRVRKLAGREPETERQAASILTGAGGRELLTASMVLEVDQVVAKLKGLDAKFLGLTMVMLIEEAEKAKEAADRVAALVQMVALMEKLMKQLSPWHVRHKEAVATVIAIVGSLVGLASAVSGFLR